MKISDIRKGLKLIKESAVGIEYKDDLTRDQSIVIVNAILAVYKHNVEQLDYELNAWYNNLKSTESYFEIFKQFEL